MKPLRQSCVLPQARCMALPKKQCCRHFRSSRALLKCSRHREAYSPYSQSIRASKHHSFPGFRPHPCGSESQCSSLPCSHRLHWHSLRHRIGAERFRLQDQTAMMKYLHRCRQSETAAHCLHFHAPPLPTRCWTATIRQQQQMQPHYHQFVSARLHRQRHQQLIQQRQQQRSLRGLRKLVQLFQR